MDRLWGVGPKTRARLAELGVQTCADLARLPLDSLVAQFGKSAGQGLYNHARGVDDSAVVTHHDLKQISQETTFVQDVVDRARLWSTIRELSDGVARRLARHGVLARTITLKVRYADFQLLTRSASLILPSDDAAAIAQAAATLVRANWDRNRPIRLVGVGATRLVSAASWHQLPLPIDERAEDR